MFPHAVRTRVLLIFGFLSCWPLARAQGTGLLPENEQAWLAAHPHIRFGYDPDWPPFTFRAQDGHLIGIDADILALLGQRLGLSFELVSSADWNGAYAAARSRQIDALLGTISTPERAAYFNFSRTYLSFPMAIVSRDEAPTVWTMAKLDGKRVAVVPNYAVTSRLKAISPGATLVLEPNVAETLRAVVEGRADAAVTNLANATFLIETKGYTNLRVVGLGPTKSDLHYAVRNDWPELVDILNRGIASLTEEEIRAINDRWIKVKYEPGVRWDHIWKFGGAALLAVVALFAAIAYHNRRLARELSTRIRLQKEIEHARDELKRLNEDKVWLMEMAAHDLRSPLTAMQMLADLSLKQRGLPAEEAMAQLEPHIGRMLALLNNLFDVHAIEEGRRPVNARSLDLGELTSGVIRAAQGSADAKVIRIQASGLGEGLRTLGDEVAVRQVVENLVSNSLKFSPAGGTVEIALRKAGDLLRLEVRDHGPGVPESERERIFAKYARGTARPTAGEKSTGLGLAIVRSLVEAMRGQIWCEAADPGARFVVVLPAA